MDTPRVVVAVPHIHRLTHGERYAGRPQTCVKPSVTPREPEHRLRDEVQSHLLADRCEPAVAPHASTARRGTPSRRRGHRGSEPPDRQRTSPPRQAVAEHPEHQRRLRDLQLGDDRSDRCGEIRRIHRHDAWSTRNRSDQDRWPGRHRDAEHCGGGGGVGSDPDATLDRLRTVCVARAVGVERPSLIPRKVTIRSRLSRDVSVFFRDPVVDAVMIGHEAVLNTPQHGLDPVGDADFSVRRPNVRLDRVR